MASNPTSDAHGIPDSVARNAGARTTAVNHDPSISLQKGEYAAAGDGPNSSGGPAPSEDLADHHS